MTTESKHPQINKDCDFIVSRDYVFWKAHIPPDLGSGVGWAR